jgi:Na+-transporting methylmalonyl-CoA/oxaloacetate decarboxylase gamma subunit
VTVLAAASSNDVAPGTLGFLVVFGMAVVLFFLFRSMSKHLRRVNAAARKDERKDEDAGSPESKTDGDNAGATAASSGAPGPGDRRSDS